MTPEHVRQMIREELADFIKSDRMILDKTLQLQNGRNIQLGQTVGTKIGTSITQKIGFLGVTPVIRRGIAAPYTAGDIGQGLIDLGLFYRNN